MSCGKIALFGRHCRRTAPREHTRELETPVRRTRTLNQRCVLVLGGSQKEQGKQAVPLILKGCLMAVSCLGLEVREIGPEHCAPSRLERALASMGHLTIGHEVSLGKRSSRPREFTKRCCICAEHALFDVLVLEAWNLPCKTMQIKQTRKENNVHSDASQSKYHCPWQGKRGRPDVFAARRDWRRSRQRGTCWKLTERSLFLEDGFQLSA